MHPRNVHLSFSETLHYLVSDIHKWSTKTAEEQRKIHCLEQVWIYRPLLYVQTLLSRQLGLVASHLQFKGMKYFLDNLTLVFEDVLWKVAYYKLVPYAIFHMAWVHGKVNCNDNNGQLYDCHNFIHCKVQQMCSNNCFISGNGINLPSKWERWCDKFPVIKKFVWPIRTLIRQISLVKRSYTVRYEFYFTAPLHVAREYYTAVRRYEIYLRMVKTIFYEWVKYHFTTRR